MKKQVATRRRDEDIPVGEALQDIREGEMLFTFDVDNRTILEVSPKVKIDPEFQKLFRGEYLFSKELVQEPSENSLGVFFGLRNIVILYVALALLGYILYKFF